MLRMTISKRGEGSFAGCAIDKRSLKASVRRIDAQDDDIKGEG